MAMEFGYFKNAQKEYLRKLGKFLAERQLQFFVALIE
jgi:hypothetical protein